MNDSSSILRQGNPAPGRWTERRAHSLLRGWLDRLHFGALSIELPDGSRMEAHAHLPGPAASLRLLRWRPLWRLLVEGDLGLALSWRDGDWTSPDLPALLELGVVNEAYWRDGIAAAGPMGRLLRLLHAANANTRRGSRRNIAAHYDLGNAFYGQWLDASMLYSSALYTHEGQSLESAQAAKLERICALLQLDELPSGGSVLEIGCGWGALALTLAQARDDIAVTGLTLSKEQLAHAQARVTAAGRQGQVDLRLQDYRDVSGRFDRIVSIEMIEAVGEAYWPVYFATLRERLAPGGVVVLQAITINDDNFDSYRRGADFIQRYIFPGGMLPCPQVLHEQAARAGFVIEETQCFGSSYARTLVEWRRRFLAAWPAIEPLGFDAAFQRLWDYYLSYCEAGFRAGKVDVGLYRLRRMAS